MTLEVDPAEVADVPKPFKVEPNDIPDEARILNEPLHAIVRGCGVSGCALIPARTIHFQIPIHQADDTE